MPLTPHPQNTGFVWTDRPRTGLRRLAPADVDRFNAAGFIVLEDVVPAAARAALIAAIDPIEAAIDDYTIRLEDRAAFTYARTAMTFANDIALEAPAVGDFCAGALFQDIAHDLVGPDVRLYWNQAVYKKPEEGREFPWHQDNGYTYCEPQTYLTCWIALTDAGIEDGCPWVIPGLHRGGTYLHAHADFGLEIAGIRASGEVERAVAAPVRAGDMVVFSSLTPHMTGANLSNKIRKALILQYAPDGIAQVERDGRRVVQDDPERNRPVLIGGRAPPNSASRKTRTPAPGR